MLWELIATITAGLGAAGIALIIRKLSKHKAPAWLIPTFAGCAMLGFQIHSEYNWFKHQSGLLPEGLVVVSKIEQQAIWRPWSLLYPQTLRFIAADINNAAANKLNADIKLVDLYFFERRMQAKRVPQVIHCTQYAQADFSTTLSIPQGNALINKDWRKLAVDDPLLQAVCQS